MTIPLMTALLCYLLGQIKGVDTSTIRMVLAIVGLVLWFLCLLGLSLHLPACLTAGP